MQRISITNPQNIIDGTAKKYYFKLRNTGGPKGDKGDKGDTGATGPQGPQGDPCTVVVNSTATLEPGSNAYVTNTGSLSNAVLNFGIPQGPRGPQGAKGDKGDTGAQGETGPRGPQGERGTNATVYVGTTSTLNPGSQATVYNSGSDSNAVLNFGIPRGDVGPQGPTGPAGQNFAPTIVAELPATGDESKLYLTPKAHTTQTATGNPITATVAEEAGAIESFQLDGDTFQQSYEGKNLLAYPYFNTTKTTSGITFTDNGDGSVTINGTLTGINEVLFWITREIWSYNTANIVVPAGTYTISPTGNPNVRVFVTAYGETQGLLTSADASTASATFTIAEKASLTIRISVKPQGTAVNNLVIKPQLESGSTATSYEPYVGGQPSPNPDYPQAIQTVTGLQTISINGTDYPIDLGSIELCKLGTYQDYIWKDGDDWKVHKATASYQITGQESDLAIYALQTNTTRFFSSSALTATGAAPGNNIALSVCNRLPLERNWATDVIGIYVNESAIVGRMNKTIIGTTVEEARNYFANNPTIIYYQLATPTDTIITDTALIAQLEAIRTASLQNGANTITNTATAPNLAGDMEIGYYGYNPRNRYDKWLWIDGAWERMDDSETIEALARNQVDGNLRDLMNFEVGDISAATGENVDGGKLLRNDRIYKFNFSLYIPASEVTKTTLYTYTDEGEFIREIFPFTNNTKGWFVPANTSFRIRLDYNTIPGGGRPTITDPKTSPIYQNFSIVPFEDYKANTLAKLQSEGNVIDPSNLKYSLRLAIADINYIGIDYSASANRRMATYDILHFDHDIVLPKQSNFYFYLWTYTDQSGAGASGQGWKYLTDSEYVIPAGTYFRLLFVIDRASTTPLYDIYDNDIFKAIEIYKKVEQATTIQFNPNMRSVAHQGYSTTSQTYGNSRLSSYVGAKKHGFDYGECDIKFSSDGVPVCCHDASFNSGGQTIVIAEHTWAELQTYNYYGETIASLDEVVKLCKELGLGLYIDHLDGNWSDAYWNTIFGIVKKYQMQDNVYWLQGISRTLTTKILTWYKKAKIALAVSTNNLTSAITEANEIKTDFNTVSIDFDYSKLAASDLESYLSSLNAGIELEAWTIDNSDSYISYLPYLKAITSNKLCYNDFYKQIED